MTTPCHAMVTARDAERRPCAHHAKPGTLWCLKHALQERRILAARFARNLDEANRYADVMSRRDREARHTGRPDHDYSTDGRKL